MPKNAAMLKIYQIEKELKGKIREIDELVLREIQKDANGTPLTDSAKHLILAGGKRIRSLLLLLACEAVGGNYKNAMPVAGAIEFFHTMSLIHDDIIDESTKRRKTDAVHVKWGVPVAIISGDYLFSKAFQIAGSHLSEFGGIDENKKMKVLNLMSEFCVTTSLGEMHDIHASGLDGIDEKACLEIAYKKTAKTFENALRVGAIMGNGTNEEVEALGNYGRAIGMAFQVQDDLLDITDEKMIGKNAFNDTLKGKKTIVLQHFLTTASDDRIARARELMKIADDAAREELRKIIGEAGSIEHTKRLVRQYVIDSKMHIKGLTKSHAKETLLRLSNYAEKRVS